MPKTTLAERLNKQKEPMREAYRQGKRTYEFEGVKFRLHRCGPEHNYLAVSPVAKDRGTPVLNFPYDVTKHDDMMELRRGKNMPTGKRRKPR